MGVLIGGENKAISSAVGRATGEIATAEGATNVVSGLNLNKSLASQQQLSELAGQATSVAGNGSNSVLRDAPRLAAEYRGKSQAQAIRQRMEPSTKFMPTRML